MNEGGTTTVPTHVGFILDGNRRWARSHSIPEMDGHLAGYNALKEVLDAGYERGIKYVTVYAFSNENWSRTADEVSSLMRLTVKAFKSDLHRLIEREVRVLFLGRRDRLSTKIVSIIESAEEQTKDFTKGTLCICFNYGGLQEIVDAARKCVEDGLKPEEITEQAIDERVYAPDVPPLDIIVRTSGEQRLSNFMLWRSGYSELLFLEKNWPDMTKQDVTDIIEEYSRRTRRFGQ